MIYGFITDTVFHPKSTVSLKENIPNVCYLDDNMVNYFHEHGVVTDPRTERLAYNNQSISGTIQFHFDTSKQEDPTIFSSKITTEEYEKLFSIFENIYLANTKSLVTIESILSTNSNWKDVYVAKSLTLSPVKVTATMINPSGTLQMATWFRFKVKFAAITDPLEFKIWVGRDAFNEDYPLSTICKVVLPVDPRYILDPSKASGPVDMLIKSNEYSFGELEIPVAGGDHSGFLTYKTKYVLRKPVSTQLLPFGILYQGAQPTTMEIREAIRNVLLDLGIASQQQWEDVLPDLFVVGIFYMLPIWDHVTIRPERKFFPSVIALNKFNDKLSQVFPSYEGTYIPDHQEVLTCAQSEIFILALADILNESDKQSIYSLHPTYQFHNQMDSAFANMDSITQDFSIRLNRCMAVAMGETTLADVTTNIIDEKIWFSFVSNKVEYHILSKESYNEVFAK